MPHQRIPLCGGRADRRRATLASGATAHAQTGPLVIAKQGYFFVGGKYTKARERRCRPDVRAIPGSAKAAHRYPVVMIQAAARPATISPGRPTAARAGRRISSPRYSVYVVDQVGRGRSAHAPKPRSARRFSVAPRGSFTGPERLNSFPKRVCTLNGRAAQESPAFDQFYASKCLAWRFHARRTQRCAIIALLDKIGPAILLTHSQSGPFGWSGRHAAGSCEGDLAVEPNGPPVHEVELSGAPDWFNDNPDLALGHHDCR